MDPAQKIKVALDETRMLVLGAQVLLGFQLQGTFQERFDDLAGYARGSHAFSLVLTVVVIGCLIAPAIHHRVVEDGNATSRTLHRVSLFMSIALLPFAVSLGLNVFIAMKAFAGGMQAVMAGLAATAGALWFWFGLAWVTALQKGRRVLKPMDEQLPLSTKIDQMLTEARVIVPGAQALLGFQLAVVLTHAFENLPTVSKAVHALALGLIAISTILLMAPAAYHRIAYNGEASEHVLALGGRLLMSATLALALGLATDAYVVIAKISDSQLLGLFMGVVSATALISLWHVLPLIMRAKRFRNALW